MGNEPDIPFNGFNRVVVTEFGEAVLPNVAIRDYHTSPAIGFRRDDGWSVGSPVEFENVAFNLYPDQWTHFIRFGEPFYQPIELYEATNVRPTSPAP